MSKMKSTLLGFAIGLVVSIAVVGVFVSASEGGFLNLVDKLWVDFMMRTRSGLSHSPQLAIAAIDTKAIDEYGRWPWPRERMGRLVETLNNHYGARTIGFDIVFSEPDRAGPDSDAYLSARIEEKPNTILGYFFYTSERGIAHLTEAERAESARHIEGSEIASLINQIAPGNIPLGLAPEPNIAAISAAGYRSGFFNIKPDREDGTVRRAHLLMEYEGEFYPSLALQAVSHYYGNKTLTFVADETSGVALGIKIGDEKFVLTSFDGSLLINFKGGAHTFPHHSIHDIIEKNVPVEELSGKIVLIGATEIGLGDFMQTPLGRYPGVEIHASIIDNILTDSYFQITYANNVLTVMLMLLLGLLLGPILIHLKPLQVALVTIVLIVLYTILHRWMVVSLLSWTSYLFVVIDLAAIGAVLTVVKGHYLSGKSPE